MTATVAITGGVKAAEAAATEVQQISEGKKSEIIASDAIKVTDDKVTDKRGCTNYGRTGANNQRG